MAATLIHHPYLELTWAFDLRPAAAWSRYLSSLAAACQNGRTHHVVLILGNLVRRRADACSLQRSAHVHKTDMHDAAHAGNRVKDVGDLVLSLCELARLELAGCLPGSTQRTSPIV